MKILLVEVQVRQGVLEDKGVTCEDSCHQQTKHSLDGRYADLWRYRP